MVKKRKKRTFIKIKEKLVLVPPKKFFGRKVLGVFFLIVGSLILTFCFTYYYLIPQFFRPEPKKLKTEEKTVFLGKRIMIPELSLDLEVDGTKVVGSLSLGLTKIKAGEEIIVFSENEYRRYKVINFELKEGSTSGNLYLDNEELILALPFKTKPQKIILIKGELL